MITLVLLFYNLIFYLYSFILIKELNLYCHRLIINVGIQHKLKVYLKKTHIYIKSDRLRSNHMSHFILFFEKNEIKQSI